MRALLITTILVTLPSPAQAAEWKTHCFSHPEQFVRGCSLTSPIAFENGEGRVTYLVDGEGTKGPVIYFQDPARLVRSTNILPPRPIQIGHYKVETADGERIEGQCDLSRVVELSPTGLWVETDEARCDTGVSAGMAIDKQHLGRTIAVSVKFEGERWHGTWESSGYQQAFDAAESALLTLE